jgi:putative colanic acid biosynthesis acetyltransferase WcaF
VLKLHFKQMGNTTDLSKFDNSHYKPGRGFLIRGLWYWVNLCVFNSYLFPFYGLKRLCLRMFGAEIEKGVLIKPKVNIKYPWKLSIGENSWIGELVWIDNLAEVKIGKNCCLSQASVLLCGNHNYKKSTFDLITKPIILEESVWIGAGSMVTGGVVCGSYSILSVKSVASDNMESFGIYRGNPAVKISERKIEA